MKYDLGELVSHFQLSIPHFCLFRPSMCSLFVSYIRFARCSLYISSLVLHCSPHVHLCISELWPVFKRFWRVFRNILCIYIYIHIHITMYNIYIYYSMHIYIYIYIHLWKSHVCLYMFIHVLSGYGGFPKHI